MIVGKMLNGLWTVTYPVIPEDIQQLDEVWYTHVLLRADDSRTGSCVLAVIESKAPVYIYLHSLLYTVDL